MSEASPSNEIPPPPHPILTVLENNRQRIHDINASYPQAGKTADISGQQWQFIKVNYGFLADALNQTPPYSLEPQDLIAIWQEADDYFTDVHQRSALANMIATVFCVRALGPEKSSKEKWHSLPRYLLEHNQLPSDFMQNPQDTADIQTLLARIEKIIQNCDQTFYLTDEALARKIRDDFGNGLTPLKVSLEVETMRAAKRQKTKA